MTISGLKDNPQFLYKSQLLLFELEPNFKQGIWSSFKNCRSFNKGTSHFGNKSIMPTSGKQEHLALDKLKIVYIL